MLGLWSKNAPRWDIEKEMPDLEGKVVIVTGGNSGLGFATIQHLVRSGANIYMAARSGQRAKDAIARLDFSSEGGKKASVKWLKLNLSDPKMTQQAAEEFLRKEERLDVLVNNAALTLDDSKKSLYDIQDTMVINHLSPFVFTNALLPLLKQTAKGSNSDVRIVNVGSEAIYYMPSDVRFRNKEDFNEEYSGFMAQLRRYGRSKVAMVLYTKELQKRLDAEGIPILVISLHPGTINTEGNQKIVSRGGRLARPVMLFMSEHFTPSPPKGAYTQVFAAVAPVVREQADKYKGAWLMPPNVISEATKPAENLELAAELWETTERLLHEIGVPRDPMGGVGEGSGGVTRGDHFPRGNSSPTSRRSYSTWSIASRTPISIFPPTQRLVRRYRLVAPMGLLGRMRPSLRLIRPH